MNLNQKSIFWGRQHIVLLAVLAMAAAFALNAFIQYRIEMMQFIWTDPLLFIYTSLILFLTIVFCSSLLGNVFFGSAIMFGFFIILTFVDRNKYVMRGEHIFPEDLIVSDNLRAFSGMYDSGGFVRQISLIVIIAIVALAMTLLIIVAQKKSGMYQKPGGFGRVLFNRILFRVAAAGLSVLMLIAMVFPIVDNKPIMSRIGFDHIGWSQNLNYAKNGFVAAFISNMSKAKLDEPDGYSENTIRVITEKYIERAENDNTSRQVLEDECVDIVFVLNESFIDPSRIADIYPFSGGDVTPNLHRLEQEAPAGILRTSQFGGGTANVEFEVLTGFSLFFSNESAAAFQGFIVGRESFPSFAHYLKEAENYQTLGMHPYDPAMYKRSSVYPILGFDAFLSQNDFVNGAPYETAYYISDISAYDEVLFRLDAVESGENVFVNLVTMQNHGSYGNQLSYHPYTSEVDPSEGYSPRATDDYLALLNSSDAALGDFAKRVLGRDKKTMLIFYGDHLPGVYNDLLEENDDRKYETPLLILANFGNPYFEIGTISPNYISVVALNYMDVQKSPFFYLLDDVKKENPILVNNYFNTREDPEVYGALADYYMIMYDTVSGNGYAEGMGFFSLK